ncbi:MAG: hypothetical protein K0S45_2911 [Nitrospira sp.]|jgi:hypothetical protein|nr:hypothetical protein [Nitrospira sp.]
MDPSIAAAAVEYRDACGQVKTLPIRAGLEKEIKTRMGQVFEDVQMEAKPSDGAPDAVVDVALGLREVNLFVPRKANKSYPATVTLGLDFSYIDQQGAVLHSKKLQSVASGEVEGRAETCDISGLDHVAQETIVTLVEGMAKHLGTDSKIREHAQLRKTGRTMNAPPPAIPAGATLPTIEPTPVLPPQQSDVALTPDSRSSAVLPANGLSGPTKLSFRTIIRDDNQNHVLEQQEPFSVEFEVKNDGTAVAQAIEIVLSGHAAIVGGLNSPVFVGTLQPGEVRRVAVDGKVGPVLDVEQAELVCTLRASPNVELPSAKKFFVAIRPDLHEEIEVLSVDVDQLPKANGKVSQAQAVGIAIGVGAFRDQAMPPVKFAAHDAEVMGQYFKTILGIPPQKVRVALDDKGLRDDLIDLFEQWLPAQGGPQQTAYIYFSGRAVVDHETGMISLLPFDGTSSGTSRAFSLARLQRALARAPMKRAVLMLDLSLEPSSGSDPGRAVQPRWNQQDPGTGKDQVMLMAGNSSLQEAQAYQPGQHGLFTYFLLKGLRGAADLDKNGTVVARELCAYVHGQVEAVTRAQSGMPQQTLCLPASGERSPLGALPFTKVR